MACEPPVVGTSLELAAKAKQERELSVQGWRRVAGGSAVSTAEAELHVASRRGGKICFWSVLVTA